MIYYVFNGVLLYIIGMMGIFITRKNVIIILMCIELMLLGINTNFVIYSIYLDDIEGQVVALYVLTVAAAESAIGLAILVVYYIVYYRIRGVITTQEINNLKG
jgi:NADH-quinone oxidoreductase subunit K